MIATNLVYAGMITLGLYFLVLSQALIYLFQIKEYRFDRLFSHMREEGAALVYKNFGKRSAVSVRNILIFVVAGALFLLWNFMIFNVLLFIISDPGSCSSNLKNPLSCDGQTPGYKIPILFTPLISFAAFFLLTAVAETILVVIVVDTAVLLTEPFALLRRKRLIERAMKQVSISKTVFIGISGTYGKSTTKEYLAHILSAKYKVGKTDKNMNTDVGVAVSILKNLKPDTEYFVAEVGAYKPGEVRRAAKVFSPKVAIILPFGNQHMSLFGSKANLIKAECEILEYIPKDGAVYANADIPELQYILSHTRSGVKTYSITKKADIYATHITATGEGSEARVAYGTNSMNVKTKLLGKHVIQNLLPAIAVAADFGMTTKEIAAAIATITPVTGKLSLHQKNGAVILNDTGNSSLHGFLAAIDTIKLFKRENIYILSKGIIELGNEKEESYKKIIMQIEEANIYMATTDKLFKKFDTKNLITIEQNEADLKKYIVSKMNAKTAILLEGKFTPKFVKSLI